ncbi:MAG: ABC transporter substrate-binding protein [Alphaproteobacteria bacterium]
MTKKHDDNAPISATKFMEELRRYQRGSVSRRHFLGVTGLGTAMAVLGSAMPSLIPRPAHASEHLGNRLIFSTWPNYHNPANIEAFTAETGVNIQINAFGSNEEMLAKLQAGATGWDVFVPTNYTISNYVELDIIQELDLSRLPNHDPSSQNPMFSNPATVNGKVYAVLKNWGTTGIVSNSNQLPNGPTSWKDFFEITMGEGSGHTIVHDYQLTTIGAALLALGYSFNSVDENELAEAEALLIESKPHLFAITSDYQPGLRSGDAWMSICWNGDGLQLNKDLPEMKYIIASDGGEIWSDFYCIPKEAPHLDAAYAFINYLLDPAVQVLEFESHGYATGDARVEALLPPETADNEILFPAAELMNGLEFGAAETLTDPFRAEVLARFKSA